MSEASKRVTNLLTHFKSVSIDSIIPAPNIKRNYNNVDIDYLMFLPLGKDLIYFTEVLTENVDNISLTNYYNNINSFNIDFNHRYIVNIGEYRPAENSIIIGKKANKDAIYHELLHLASSYYDKKSDIIYSGFSQCTNNSNIGFGLTEGYTEYLNQTYFSDYTTERSKYTYTAEVLLCTKLNALIGKNKLNSFYFNSNLPGLIDELAKYSTKDEAVKFIETVDYMTCSQFISNMIPVFEGNYFIDSFINALDFILLSRVKKLSLAYENEKITYDKLVDFIDQAILNIQENKYRKEKSTNELKQKILEYKK